MLSAWLGLACELTECDPGPGTVDLLRRVLPCGAKGCVVGDAAPVAVDGDGVVVASPRHYLARVARRLTEWPRPGCSGIACGIEYRVSTGLDRLPPLIENMPHAATHRSVR